MNSTFHPSVIKRKRETAARSSHAAAPRDASF